MSRNQDFDLMKLHVICLSEAVGCSGIGNWLLRRHLTLDPVLYAVTILLVSMACDQYHISAMGVNISTHNTEAECAVFQYVSYPPWFLNIWGYFSATWQVRYCRLHVTGTANQTYKCKNKEQKEGEVGNEQ